MITERSKALILLTGYLPKADTKTKPLSTAEYSRLAGWLHQREFLPEDLTGPDQATILNNWDDYKIPKERVKGLLSRVAKSRCLGCQ